MPSSGVAALGDDNVLILHLEAAIPTEEPTNQPGGVACPRIILHYANAKVPPSFRLIAQTTTRFPGSAPTSSLCFPPSCFPDSSNYNSARWRGRSLGWTHTAVSVDQRHHHQGQRQEGAFCVCRSLAIGGDCK